MPFTPNLTLYHDNDFTVSWGTWDGNQQRCVGMRWAKWPHLQIGQPAYLVIDDVLQRPWVASLLGLPGADKQNILIALGELP
jgi:hypothetical protein